MSKQIEIGIGINKDRLKTDAQGVKGEIQKLNKDLVDDVRKAKDEEVGLTRKSEQAKDSLMRDGLGRFVAANKSAAADAGAAMETVGRRGAASFERIGAATAVVQMGLNKIISLAGSAAQAFEAAGAKSRELAGRFTSQRDQLGELASLMGKPADNAFALNMAKFGVKTGLRSDEARQFLTEVYNSGAQYEGKNLSAKSFTEFGEKTGALAAARQIRPDVVGDVAGSMLGFTNYEGKFGPKAATMAAADVNTVLATLGRGKGDNAVLARQFSMLASASLNEDALKGTFQSPDDVAAVVSIGAEKHDAQAAELAKIAGRALRDKDKNALIDKAGVLPSDSFIASMEKINAVVQAEVKARQKSEPGLKVEDVLRENLKDEAAVDALNVFLNKGVAGGGFKDRLDFAAQNRGESPLNDVLGGYYGSERGRARVAEADVGLAQAERGAENSRLDILRKQALARLTREKRIDTNTENIRAFVLGNASFGVLGSGEQTLIDAEAQRLLNERTPAGTEKMEIGDVFGAITPTGREEFMNRRMAQVEAAGGKPLGDASGQETTQLLREQNALLRQLVDNSGPSMLPEANTTPRNQRR